FFYWPFSCLVPPRLATLLISWWYGSWLVWAYYSLCATNSKHCSSKITITRQKVRILLSGDGVHQVRFGAISFTTVKKFFTIAECVLRCQATAISVCASVPSSSRYTTP